MDFIEQLQIWEKGELIQGKVMIGIGIAFLLVCFIIFRSQNELLKGTLIPMGLLVLILVGYGGYILYSRPAHVKQSITLYEKSKQQAFNKEFEKHTNDNKAGKSLMQFVYPSLILLAALVLLLVSSSYYRGMALGFALLFIATYIIDNGFVTRSDTVIKWLESIH